MANLFLLYRSFFTGLFIICNAIVCSVSVWNLSMARYVQLKSSQDAFMIALAAAGLLFIFPIMFIDFTRKSSLTSQVWFECLWVGVFWILNLSGAAAITATFQTSRCVLPSGAFISLANGEETVVSLNSITGGECTSAQVLMAFTWINVANLLIYLSTLTVRSIMQAQGSQVWHSSVRQYPWNGMRDELHLAPSSARRSWRRSLHLSSSRLSVPARDPFSEKPYDLERPSPAPESLTSLPLPPVPMAPPPQHMIQATRQATTNTRPSLYSEHVQPPSQQSSHRRKLAEQITTAAVLNAVPEASKPPTPQKPPTGRRRAPPPPLNLSAITSMRDQYV